MCAPEHEMMFSGENRIRERRWKEAVAQWCHCNAANEESLSDEVTHFLSACVKVLLLDWKTTKLCGNVHTGLRLPPVRVDRGSKHPWVSNARIAAIIGRWTGDWFGFKTSSMQKWKKWTKLQIKALLIQSMIILRSAWAYKLIRIEPWWGTGSLAGSLSWVCVYTRK